MHVLHDKSVIDTAETLEITEAREKKRAVRAHFQKEKADAAPVTIIHHHDKMRGSDPRWSGLNHVRD
jgi:hypothetical protein